MRPFKIGHIEGYFHDVNHFWFTSPGSNSLPFDILKVDKDQYIRDIVGYTPRPGGFPFLRNESDLLLVCQQLNRDILALPKGDRFRVGDIVEITRSKTAWNDQMDLLHGRKVEILQIYSQDEQDCRIRFTGGDRWNWSYAFGHFKPFPDCKTTPLEHISGVQQGKTGVTPILINVCKIN